MMMKRCSKIINRRKIFTTIVPTIFFAGGDDALVEESLSSDSVLSITTIAGVRPGVGLLVDPPRDGVRFIDWLRE